MAIFIDYEKNTGEYNMQFDADILDKAIIEKSNEPIIRFYGWIPSCVSLGRNQSFDDIDIEYCKNQNIDIIKRPTGGRALFHDDEITYSFVSPASFLQNGHNIISSYKEISSAIIMGFATIGIQLEIGNNEKKKLKNHYCMLLSTGADICYNGKKVIGSAQYRKKDYILQHGSIVFSLNNNKIKNIFNEEIESEHIITINEINPNLSKTDVIQALKTGFKKYFKI